MYAALFVSYLLVVLQRDRFVGSSPVPAAALQARCADENDESCYNPPPPPDTQYSSSKIVQRNGISLGLFPNPDETLCELERIVDAPFAYYGLNVKLTAPDLWDGSEVFDIMDDLKKTHATLQISLIPESTWYGLTEKNCRQAEAIGKTIRAIQDALGKPVWLRFAPDMNCLPGATEALASQNPVQHFPSAATTTVSFETPIQASIQPSSTNSHIILHGPSRRSDNENTDAETEFSIADDEAPTANAAKSQKVADLVSFVKAAKPKARRHAKDNANDFITAWNAVHKAVKAAAPDTKMVWSPAPSATDMHEYHTFYPDEAKPDIVGLTYEPTHCPNKNEFIAAMKPFHDAFASEDKPFMLTRTALNVENSSPNDKIKFLNVITHEKAKRQLPHYTGAIYHNFDETADKRILVLQREPKLDVGKKSTMNGKTKAWVQKNRAK